MFPFQMNQEIHIQNLDLLCRVCGGVKFSQLSPSVKVDKIILSKYIKKLYDVEVAGEDSAIYPVKVCQSCERKLKRFYLIVSKRKKCSFSKDSLASFIAHSEESCLVCSVGEEQKILDEKPTTEIPEPVLLNVVNDGLQEENCAGESNSSTPRRNPPRKPLISAPQPSSLVSSQTQTENDFTDVDTLSSKWFNKVKVSSKYNWKYSNKRKSKVNASYFRKLKFKPLCIFVDKFCSSQQLNKVEAMFFLLLNALQESGDKTREVLIRDVWSKKNDIQCLSLEQCLAMRVLLKLTKENYKKQYTYYKEKLSKCVLKSPCHVDKHEKCFLPRSVDYHLTDASEVVVRHHATTCSVALTCKPNLPDVIHSRWLYSDVIAKTLQEVIHLFKKDLPSDSNQSFKVTIKEHFEEKSPECERCGVPPSLPTCSANTSHLPPRLLTGYCTLVALQTVGDLGSVIRMDDTVTETCRPFLRALYTSMNSVSTSNDRLSVAEQKELCSEMTEQRLNASTHPSLSAAIGRTTNQLNPVVTLNKNVRSSLVTTASSFGASSLQLNQSTASKVTSLLSSNGDEPWLCPPSGAPSSLAALLDVVQQERQELISNVLHVVCPNSNTTYRFVVAFESPRPEVLKDYRNTRGLLRPHPCDEKNWLPRALAALSRASAAQGRRTCPREQGGSKPVLNSTEGTEADCTSNRASDSQPPLLDMVRLFLATSPRLKAAGSVKTRGQRITNLANRAAPLTSKAGRRRTKQRSAPRPEAAIQRTEDLHTTEEIYNNREDRSRVFGNPNDVFSNIALEKSTSEDWIESKGASSGYSKTGRSSEDQLYEPTSCASVKEGDMREDFHYPPYSSQSLQSYSSNTEQHVEEVTFDDNHYRSDMVSADSSSTRFGCKLKRPPYSTSNQYPPWSSYSPLEPAVLHQTEDRPDTSCGAGSAGSHHHNDTISLSDAALAFPQTTYAAATSGAVDTHMDITEVHHTAYHVHSLPPVPPSGCSNDVFSNNYAPPMTTLEPGNTSSVTNEKHHSTALSPVVRCKHNGSVLATTRPPYTDPATALNLTPVSRSGPVEYSQQENPTNINGFGSSSHWH